MFPWETLITGAVGVAGIGGTLWQGKRAREAQTADLKTSLDATAGNLNLSISAENYRARQTEKRRVYAAFLAAIDRLGLDSAHRKASGEKGPPVFGPVGTATAMVNALTELQLIAPAHISELGAEVAGLLNEYAAKISFGLQDTEMSPQYASKKAELHQAMRADLGEPD